MKTKQLGFTLIELVVVIAVLGILAAMALPRYLSLSADARGAKLSGALGAMKAAAALSHAGALTENLGNAATTINMEGVAINMLNMYPTANAGGIIASAQVLSTDGFTISAGGAAAGSTITISPVGAANPATCVISYTSPTGPNISPTFSAPLSAATIEANC